VPPSEEELICSICFFRAKTFVGLRRHRNARHRRASGLGFSVGLKRRRSSNDEESADDADDGDGDDVGQRHSPGGGDPGAATDEESTPPPAEEPSDRSSSFRTGVAALKADLRALYDMTQTEVSGDDAADSGRPQFKYAAVLTHIRALYDEMKDFQRATSLAVLRRKRPHTERFNSHRLRALQQFVLEVGGAGLTLAEQDRLLDFLNVWEGTKPGVPKDASHSKILRDSFDSASAFRSALADDLDVAVNHAGWKMVVLTESGVEFEAYFRSVIVHNVITRTDAGKFRWWSGGSAPAPIDERRETPMDGEVFKLFESAVSKGHGEDACVLGLCVYSGSSQLSWSGGTFSFSCSSAGECCCPLSE